MRSPFARTSLRHAGWAAVSLVLVAVTESAALDIADCSQSVPDGEVGVLIDDVVCPVDSAIGIGKNATLLLDGHTITAANSAAPQTGVYCLRGRCTLVGPGEVSGFAGIAIAAFDRSRLIIQDVSVHHNRVGLDGYRVEATRCQFNSNDHWGASAVNFKIDTVDASQNGDFGLGGHSLRGSGVTASGNAGSGIYGNRVRLANVVAMTNGQYGVRSTYPGVTQLFDSDLGLNGWADIGSQKKPALHRTLCRTSRRLSDAGSNLGTWGVCTED